MYSHLQSRLYEMLGIGDGVTAFRSTQAAMSNSFILNPDIPKDIKVSR